MMKIEGTAVDLYCTREEASKIMNISEKTENATYYNEIISSNTVKFL